jgi:hypothetical protein
MDKNAEVIQEPAQTKQPNEAADQSLAQDVLQNQLIDYGNSIDNLSKAKDGDRKQEVLNVLMARNAIGHTLSSSKSVPHQLRLTLAELDRKLKDHANLVVNYVGSSILEDWRDTFQPPPSAWWWALDKRVSELEQKRAALWIILTGFAVTLTLSIAADVSSRFLSGGPDRLGILSTSSQVFLALLAGSTFTQAGRVWLGNLFSSFHIRRGLQPFFSFLLALLVLGAVIGFRYSLPSIARYYNHEGSESFKQNKVAEALANFQRAISLDPENSEAQYNLAYTYESIFDYDKAIAGYQKTIEGKPDFDAAYNNLAHLSLVYRSDYKRALDILSRLLSMPISDNETKYAAYKNRGWAFLGQQQYELAETDLKLAKGIYDRAEIHCMLGQALQGQGKKDDALTEWVSCIEMSKKGDPKGLEPYWLSVAMKGIREGE